MSNSAPPAADAGVSQVESAELPRSSQPRTAALPNRRDLALIGLLALPVVAVAWISAEHPLRHFSAYLPLHTAIEMFAVTIAGLVFAVSWHARGDSRPQAMTVMSALFLGVALLDFAHLMSFPGMPDFHTASSPEKAIWFWLAARTLAALGLLCVAALPDRAAGRATRAALLAGVLAVSAAIYALVLLQPGALPRMVVPGEGLTPARRGAEYLIVALHAIAMIALLRRAGGSGTASSRHLFAAVCISALGELIFILCREVADPWNLLAHIYKLVAYLMIYRGVVVENMREPFQQLRRSEVELLEAKRSLQLAVEASRVTSWMTDLRTGQVFVSENWAEVVGDPVSGPVTTMQALWSLVHPEDRERVTAASVAAVKGESAEYLQEHRMRAADGEWRWIRSHGRVIERDGSGRALRMAGTNINVTERKQMEISLRDSEARLGGVIATAMEAIITMDAQRRIRSFNPAAERIFGYRADEVLGRQVNMLIPARFHAAHDEYVEQFGRAEHTSRTMGAPGKVAGRRRDGREFPIEAAISRIDTAQGPLFSVVLRDITERVQADTILRETTARFEVMVSQVPGMVFRMLQRSLKTIEFVYVSEGCLALTGVAPAQVARDADQFLKLIHFDDRHGFEQSLAASAGWGSPWDWEGRIIDARATEKWINLRATPMRQSDGSLVWDGIVLNITQTRQSQERLRQSQDMLRELAAHHETVREEERASIAREIHDELGQALTAMKMDLSMLALQRGETGPEFRAKVQELKGMVDDTIQVVRNVASTLRPAALDLGIGSAVEWLAEEFRSRTGIACELKIPDDEIEIDDGRAIVLFRILQESLTNIVRHAGATRVEIALARVPGRISLSVRDNGVGFDPNSAKGKKSFGLVGIRERAIIIGGEVTIHSAAGRGAVVSVSIPC